MRAPTILAVLVAGAALELGLMACAAGPPSLEYQARTATMPCQLAGFTDAQICDATLPVNATVIAERELRGMGDCTAFRADRIVHPPSFLDGGIVSSASCRWHPGKKWSEQGCSSNFFARSLMCPA